MNRKQLILLFVALIILGGACLLVLSHNHESWDTTGTQLGKKVLPKFAVNDVAAIHIKAPDGELNVVKKNDKWRVQERGDFPANFPTVSELLMKLSDLKIAQAEPIGPSQLAHMHLADSGSEAGTVVEFKDASGKVLESLLLGKKHTQKSTRPMPAQFSGENEIPDGRYLLLKSNPGEVITVSDPLTSIDAKAAAWENRDFFKLEKPKSISFVSTNATNSWTVTKALESAPWILVDAKPTEILDTNKVSSLASTLSYPSFVDVAATTDAAVTGLDHPMVVTENTFDFLTYTLKIGKKNAEGNYYVNIEVTGDLPKERVAGTGEKAENKARLDKEFTDKMKPLHEKLDQEAALKPYTYVLNTWLIDPLVRDRAQMLVDKNAKKTDKPDAAISPDQPIEEKPETDLAVPPLDPNAK